MGRLSDRRRNLLHTYLLVPSRHSAKMEHRPSTQKTWILRRWVKTWPSPCCNHLLTVLQSLRLVPFDWLLLLVLLVRLKQYHRLQTWVVWWMTLSCWNYSYYGCESVQSATKNCRWQRTLPTTQCTSNSRQTWFVVLIVSQLNTTDDETEELDAENTTRGSKEQHLSLIFLFFSRILCRWRNNTRTYGAWG